MVEDLSPVVSRITILGKPLVCQFCQHDVFTPYEMYSNVEKPGIKCIFVQYCAPCEQCGYVVEFNDPSYLDQDSGDYIWAFEQELLYPEEPEPYTLPELSAETITIKTKIAARILEFLIEKNLIEVKWRTIFHKEHYAELTLAFDPNYNVPHEHLDIRHCVIVLSLVLIEHGYITTDEIIKMADLPNNQDEYYVQLLNEKLK